MQSLEFIDSHTGGEPTRLITELPLRMPEVSVAEQLVFLRREHDSLRRAALHEPRGADVLVGAYLVKPSDPTCRFGVIFCNNGGYLGMCGHGLIGVIACLSYLGRVEPGSMLIETPVGIVEATLQPTDRGYANRVRIKNVPSFRYLARIPLSIDGRTIHGDVAWGGNWFFLVYDHGLDLTRDNLKRLSRFCQSIRRELSARGIRGRDGAEIDHVELFAASPEADSRNFVLCSGGAYDRSPCGTGTSAKLACLHADGQLAAGQVWRQQGITGSIFEASLDVVGGQLIPSITGDAWVMARGELLVDPRDPTVSTISCFTG